MYAIKVIFKKTALTKTGCFFMQKRGLESALQRINFAHLGKIGKRKGGEKMQISKNLSENIIAMKEAFLDCGDVVMREFVVGCGKSRIFMIYTDNIVDSDTIHDFIMTNLMGRYQECNESGLLEVFMEDIIAVGEVGKIDDLQQVLDAVLLGAFYGRKSDCSPGFHKGVPFPWGKPSTDGGCGIRPQRCIFGGHGHECGFNSQTNS